MDNFTWLPFFEEMLNVICTKYDKDSLCKVFHQIFEGIRGVEDKFQDGTSGTIKEIDPLSFISHFNRRQNELQRFDFCQKAKDLLNMTETVPNDTYGLPTFLPQNPLFFGYSIENAPDAIDNAWQFSRELNADAINESTFNNVLKNKNVAIPKLTQIMYICKPKKYMVLNGPAIKYFKSKSINLSVHNFSEYLRALSQIREQFKGRTFPELVHEAYLTRIKHEYNITDEQFAFLKKRFDSRIQGFADFQKPGEMFEQNELDYKRKALKRYQDEVGNKQLRQWVEQGEGQKALNEISKRIGTNLVQFNSWRISIGDDDKKTSAILKTFLDVAEGEHTGSDSLAPIFDATEQQGLKVSWDTFSALLWAMKPEEFAPVKIRYWRSLAEELKQELPKGSVTAEKYEEVFGWMKVFWNALELHEYKPNDWVDVHSFIWCVCPDTYDNPHYWVIAPGENASYWEDFQKNGIIAIGWDKLGDLSAYQNKESIRESIQKEWGADTTKSNNASVCYKFVNDMKIGDYVFAKKGTSKMLGYGRITSEYKYVPKREWGKNVRDVEWLKTGEWETPENKLFAVKALTDITDDHDFIKSLLKLVDEKSNNPSVAVKYTKEDTMKDLFIEDSQFDEILQVLEHKKNIILQGPPGVGKTFIAERLAFAFIGYKDKQRVQTIQFHQSYSYEDFIQGYRPNENGTFGVKDGVFYEFCKKVQQDKDNKYVFIIDEINRGNLSKIFGELMMLIEPDKRGLDYETPLAYSKEGEKFYVPENLYLIGMMNTADRSLAMVDYALRRRFCFVELWPQFDSKKFEEFLQSKGVEKTLIGKIKEKLGNLNKAISDDKNNLGAGYQIGHSFFCPNETAGNYDEKWYKSVIDYEVRPLLEEYWFDDPEKAKKLVDELLA